MENCNQNDHNNPISVNKSVMTHFVFKARSGYKHLRMIVWTLLEVLIGQLSMTGTCSFFSFSGLGRMQSFLPQLLHVLVGETE